MTPAPSWHPEEPALQAYVDGLPDLLPAASVEAHLLACADCRGLVRDAVPVPRLTRVLEAIDDRLDDLERPLLERLVRRLGVGEADARALLAAPSLRLAWCAAVLGAVALALLVAHEQRDPDLVYLLLAPLLPAVTTAIAYAPGLDVALPLTAATPYTAARMLLARSFAVGVTAMLGAGAAAVALPEGDLLAVAWLLPALALTLAVLALSPRLGSAFATGAVAACWVALVWSLRRQGIDPTTAFDVTGQLLSAVLAAAALAAVFAQTRQGEQP